MYESNNKKIDKIVRIIQSHGCTVEGKKITLVDLPLLGAIAWTGNPSASHPLLCQYLNDSDKKEITEIVQSIDDELFHLYGDRQYLDSQIHSLEPVREKLSQLV